jgi:hypothetical protein
MKKIKGTGKENEKVEKRWQKYESLYSISEDSR